MMKTLDDLKADLNSYISIEKATVEAWKNVKLNKKKDGSDFAQISKSFTGAKVGRYYPVETWFSPYITVDYEYTNSKGQKSYGSDHMEIYTEEFADYREKRQSPYSSTHFHYILTPDEIMEAIQKRISMFDNAAAQHQKELEKSEELYNKYMPQFSSLVSEMKAEANSLKSESNRFNSSLYYELKECAEYIVSSGH